MKNQKTLFLSLLLLCWATALSSAPPPRFIEGAVWHRSIEDADVHPDSASMIGRVAQLGGFGLGRMQIDFSMHVVVADKTDVPSVNVVERDGQYYSPDCEALPLKIPLPLHAAIEGQSGLQCENGDCHLLLVQGRKLYELYRANRVGLDVEAVCAAVWDLDRTYPPEGRGEHCTSADAAGFPISPLLFNADEIANSLAVDRSGGGDLGHAIRFVLPNSHIATDVSLGGKRGRLYVRPASHAGAPRGQVDAIPYGARLRLRSDFPLRGYPAAARVILNTMKRYGIVLADGGRIALTAQSDRFTQTKWRDLAIHSRVFDRSLGARKVSIRDFEVLDTGPRIAETYNCRRTGT